MLPLTDALRRWPIGVLLLSVAAAYLLLVAPGIFRGGIGSALLTVSTFFCWVAGLSMILLLATSPLHKGQRALVELGIRGAYATGVLFGAFVLGFVTYMTQDTQTLLILALTIPMMAVLLVSISVVGLIKHRRSQTSTLLHEKQ